MGILRILIHILLTFMHHCCILFKNDYICYQIDKIDKFIKSYRQMPAATNEDTEDWYIPKGGCLGSFIIMIILSIVIFSCAKLKYGNVISKEYIPAHNEMIMMPMMIGKTTTMMPMFFHYSEQYKLTMYGLSTKGKYITKNIYVPSREYDTVKIGSFICLDGLCDEPIRQEIKKHK